MEGRLTPLWKGALLTLLPIALIFPVRALAHLRLAEMQDCWAIATYAVVAMWMQVQAMRYLLRSFRPSLDQVTLATVPLGALSLSSYALSAVMLVLALPQIFRHLV
jgi:hypothetical protein